MQTYEYYHITTHVLLFTIDVDNESGYKEADVLFELIMGYSPKNNPDVYTRYICIMASDRNENHEELFLS